MVALDLSRTPEAELAAAAFVHAKDDLRRVLHDATSGQELVNMNYAQDIDYAAALDVSTPVPVLHTGPFYTTAPA